MAPNSTTQILQAFINRLREGDASAVWDLLDRAFKRLRGLVATIFKGYRGDNVIGTWQTTDIASEIKIRLAESLLAVKLTDVKHFFRLAARQIRFLLSDLLDQRDRLARRKQKIAHPYELNVPRQRHGEVVLELVNLMETLPEEEYVIDLSFYLGLKSSEIATILETTPRQVRRIRSRAFETIANRLHDKFPGMIAKFDPEQHSDNAKPL